MPIAIWSTPTPTQNPAVSFWREMVRPRRQRLWLMPFVTWIGPYRMNASRCSTDFGFRKAKRGRSSTLGKLGGGWRQTSTAGNRSFRVRRQRCNAAQSADLVGGCPKPAGAVAGPLPSTPLARDPRLPQYSRAQLSGRYRPIDCCGCRRHSSPVVGRLYPGIVGRIRRLNVLAAAGT